MIETFKQASRLHRAYSINGTIYRLKTFPLIGKLIPSSEYTDGPIRTIARVLSTIKAICGFCFGEIMYILVLLGGSFAAAEALGKLSGEQYFINFFFFLMLIGIPLNNVLFDPTEDKYYGIVLLRMDPRKYVLSDLIYKLIRKAVGYILMFTIMIVNIGFSPVYPALFLITTIMGKFLGCFIKLKFVEKDKLENHAKGTVILILVILALGALITINGIAVGLPAVLALAICVCTIGGYGAYRIFTYDNYSQTCKYFLKQELVTVSDGNVQSQAVETDKKAAENNIDVDAAAPISGNKKGYAYFNDIFFRRHSKLLIRRSKVLSIVLLAICAIIAVGGFIGTRFFDMSRFESLDIILFSMPLVIYYINTGETLATAMFFNCDMAMLTYNFYRKPEVILGLFRQRLKMVVKLNLIPAILMSCCLAAACIYSTESGNLLTYVGIFLLCPALSIFFSVHRLVIYYLIQPYTEGLDKKRFGYGLVNYITYIACYMLFMANDSIVMKPITYALIASAFSAVYVVVSLGLVYKLAPKRFRLHK